MSDTNKDQDQALPEDDSAPEEEHPLEEAGAADDEGAAAEDPRPETEEPVTETETPPEPTSEAVEEPVASPSPPPPAPAPAPKKSGNGVAWLAVLIAVVAFAVVGYSAWTDWRQPEDTSAADAVAALEQRLTAAEDARDELARTVAELDALDEAGDGDVDALRREFEERVSALSALPGRMSTLESNVASLAGISATARDTWLLAEAEYYMQIANAQLQLANNPHLATLALRMADERVVQLANPALTDVRRAIANELAALDVMAKPDIEGATLTLASLARVVESLPVSSAAGDEVADQPPVDPEESGVRRAWSSVKGAMSGLVRVTPPDQAKLALLTPEAEYFLRNNIALQLQTARLALLRGEEAVFEQTLDDTNALLDDYFDVESEQVRAAKETIAEIRGSVFVTSVPDISESLRLLRQFRTLNENAQ